MDLQRLGQAPLLAAALAVMAACGVPPSAPRENAPATASSAPQTPPAMVEAPTAQPLLLEIVGADGARLSGDPAVGARLYRALCQSCHAIAPGLNGTGPSLHGVVGRAAGAVPGFAYSEANKNSGLIWTQETLFAYLERPQAMMPGTTMVFSGINQPQRRADLIAYLSQQSD